MHQNSIKINVVNDDAYRKVIQTLHEGHFIYHTYENKQQRPIRISVIEAMNKISWRKKIPLDMFILSFSSDENVTKIYEITSILGCKVQVEPLRKSKLIPQCKKYQAYGHTQKYCSKNPRCVKCAGHHLTATCEIPKTSSAKCVHCGEAHPASYRGCTIAKEYQKIKNNRMNKPNVLSRNPNVKPSNEKIVSNGNREYPHLRNKNTTYASVVTAESSNYAKPKNDDEDIKHTLQTILMKLTKFGERLEILENSVRGAKPKSNKNV